MKLRCAAAMAALLLAAPGAQAADGDGPTGPEAREASGREPAGGSGTPGTGQSGGSPGPAAATTGRNERPAPPRHAVSLSLTGLTSRALVMSYERPGLGSLLDGRYSLAGTLGLRAGASEDYGSIHLASAVEVRRWLTGWSPGAHYSEPAMVGPYLGVRLALGMVRVKDEVDDEIIGRTLLLSETVALGYRFVILDLVEITPSAGVQLRHDIELENRLPPLTQLHLTLGLTAGILIP